MKLLVTDLDNTLYDWVTYFSQSLAAMVKVTAKEFDIPETKILNELKVVHQRFHNSEHPFSILEIDSVKSRFPDKNRLELMEIFSNAFHAFNSTRKITLKLYSGVEETLKLLTENGVLIVGHTEAVLYNSYYRLVKLRIDKYFKHLYTLTGAESIHPNPNRERKLEPPEGFAIIVPEIERKPNPTLLLDICRREGILPADALYVGDSLTRDITMAVKAGVPSAWAKYGKSYSEEDWDYLVRVTHWTEEDVQRESLLRKEAQEINPDYTIDNFSEILQITSH